MAKKNKTLLDGNSNERFYTRLIIDKRLQWALGVIVSIATIIFGYLIAQNIFAKNNWLVLAPALIGLGLLFLLIPGTEEWEYLPWQAKPEQYETHFIN